MSLQEGGGSTGAQGWEAKSTAQWRHVVVRVMSVWNNSISVRDVCWSVCFLVFCKCHTDSSGIFMCMYEASKYSLWKGQKINLLKSCFYCFKKQIYLWLKNMSYFFLCVFTVERRRRDKINNWIVTLSKIIPDCSVDSRTGAVSAGPEISPWNDVFWKPTLFPEHLK